MIYVWLVCLITIVQVPGGKSLTAEIKGLTWRNAINHNFHVMTSPCEKSRYGFRCDVSQQGLVKFCEKKNGTIKLQATTYRCDIRAWWKVEQMHLKYSGVCSDAVRLYLRVSDLQMSFTDLSKWQGNRIVFATMQWPSSDRFIVAVFYAFSYWLHRTIAQMTSGDNLLNVCIHFTSTGGN